LDDIRHSYVDLQDPTHLEFRYMRLFADIITTQFDDGTVDALYVGGGGFTLPRWLSVVRPGSSHTVLELDGGLVDIAVARLGLRTEDIDRIEIGDARLTLQDTPGAAFDLVVGDAFGSLAVPWHLTTRQFLEEVRARLHFGGMYVMNVIDRPPNAFAQAEATTLREVFEHVAVVAPLDYLNGEAGGNFVFAASANPLDTADLSRSLEAREAESVVIVDDEVDRWAGEAPILRDDFAPVDQLLGN
jgi:spermidine synthase